MATHARSLAWKIPWMEEPGRLQSMGSAETDKTERLHFHFSLSCIREGNGTRLQYSCLENPRDRGAQWAAVYRVAQSQTRLKRLSSSSNGNTIILPVPLLLFHCLSHSKSLVYLVISLSIYYMQVLCQDTSMPTLKCLKLFEIKEHFQGHVRFI